MAFSSTTQFTAFSTNFLSFVILLQDESYFEIVNLSQGLKSIFKKTARITMVSKKPWKIKVEQDLELNNNNQNAFEEEEVPEIIELDQNVKEQPEDKTEIVKEDQSEIVNDPPEMVSDQPEIVKEISKPGKHFTEEQTRILMESLKCNRFPNWKTKQELSAQTGLKVKAIKSWFERNRFKKEALKKKNGNYFSKDQLEILLDFYGKCKKPSFEDKQGLALKTGLTAKAIGAWFLRQRFKIDVNDIQADLTEIDIRLLESVLQVEKSPDVDWMRRIAVFTGLSLCQVQDWFKAQRSQ